MIRLRPYQDRDVGSLRQSFAEGRRAPLYVLPTGGGKTFVFSYISLNAAKRGRRIMILVHRAELLEQASRSLAEMRVNHSLVAPGYTLTRDPVQVASVQTLARRVDKLVAAGVAPDLIVIDEAHHATAGSWRKVLEAFPSAKLLGVTATPIRLDGQGLGVPSGGVFDDLILGPSIADLTNEGFLTRARVYAPPTALDLSGLRKRGGDFAKDEVARAVDRPTITGDAVDHYARHCNGAPAIAFCAGLEHAAHVSAQFQARGFRSAVIDGTMSGAERREMLRDLARGALHVVTSCDLIGEGVDVPVVSAAILLRPTASTSLYLQQVGRALRPVYREGADLSTVEGRLAAIAQGPKPFALVLDHVGNVVRHGLPDEVRDWTLEGIAKRERREDEDGEDGASLGLLQCPKCYACHAPAPRCPQCAHVYETAGREAPEQVAGNLQEIDEVAAARLKAKRRKEIAQADTLEALEALAKGRGYKAGWARHIWNARQARRA